jgi:hypothetical protein
MMGTSARQPKAVESTLPFGTAPPARKPSLIPGGPETGNQTRVGGSARSYQTSQGELLEEIFDEYASDEVKVVD